MVFKCGNCPKTFPTSKGLSLHLYHNQQCKQTYVIEKNDCENGNENTPQKNLNKPECTMTMKPVVIRAT